MNKFRWRIFHLSLPPRSSVLHPSGPCPLKGQLLRNPTTSTQRKHGSFETAMGSYWSPSGIYLSTLFMRLCEPLYNCGVKSIFLFSSVPARIAVSLPKGSSNTNLLQLEKPLQTKMLPPISLFSTELQTGIFRKLRPTKSCTTNSYKFSKMTATWQTQKHYQPTNLPYLCTPWHLGSKPTISITIQLWSHH